MGFVQGVGAGGSGSQQSQFQTSMSRQNSWYNLPLDELENQFGVQGKTLGSMNLDELLKSMSSTEVVAQPVRVGTGDGSSSALQKQSSLNTALSKRTVDEVWKDIQQGEEAGDGVVVKTEKDNTWGEMTLEDFLSKAGAYEQEMSLSPALELDAVDTPQSLSAQFIMSPAPSVGTVLDTQLIGCKRDAPDTVVERKLKRKIKNRESAARSRARKQAYHNELISKVSSLEMDNMKLKKEKEFDKLCPGGLSDEVKYQLRRTSSTSF